MARARTIPVRDANGDQLTVYEIWEPCGLSGLAAEQRFELSTGETVAQLCDNAFVIARTSELLTCGTSKGGTIRPVRERRSALSLSGADRLSKRGSNRAALSDAPDCWLSFPEAEASPADTPCAAE